MLSNNADRDAARAINEIWRHLHKSCRRRPTSWEAIVTAYGEAKKAVECYNKSYFRGGPRKPRCALNLIFGGGPGGITAQTAERAETTLKYINRFVGTVTPRAALLFETAVADYLADFGISKSSVGNKIGERVAKALHKDFPDLWDAKLRPVAWQVGPPELLLAA
jgi:hypothetical protein